MLITSKVFEPEPWNLKSALLKALNRSMQKIELLTDLGKLSSLSLDLESGDNRYKSSFLIETAISLLLIIFYSSYLKRPSSIDSMTSRVLNNPNILEKLGSIIWCLKRQTDWQIDRKGIRKLSCQKQQPKGSRWSAVPVPCFVEDRRQGQWPWIFSGWRVSSPCRAQGHFG